MWFSNTIQDTSCVQDTGLSPHPAGFKCSREEPRQEVEGTFLLGQLGASNLTAAGEAADGPRMRGRATRPFRRPNLRPGSTSAWRPGR